MYGAPYSSGPVQTAPTGRPTVLTAGVGAVLFAVVTTLAETAFEVLLFNDFSTAMDNSTGASAGSVDSASAGLQPYLITTIVMNAFIAIGLGIGAALVMRRMNPGRIVIWSVGGVCVLVRLCCLSGLGMFGAVIAALNDSSNSSDVSLGQLAPGWEIGGSAIFGALALIAVVVGMILIGLRPAGVWLRRRTQPVAPPYRPYGY